MCNYDRKGVAFAIQCATARALAGNGTNVIHCETNVSSDTRKPICERKQDITGAALKPKQICSHWHLLDKGVGPEMQTETKYWIHLKDAPILG